ncbi:MAG: HRDC domain-containing protein [Bacilli bacterium]
MNLINEILNKKTMIDYKFPNSFNQLMDDKYYDYEKFEWFLYYYFRDIAGYEVKKNSEKGKGDGGVDLIVTAHQKDGSIFRIGIQAKYWKNRVGTSPINQLASAKKRHDLSHLWLITTSDLTSDAKEIAEDMQIKILRAEDVKKMIEDVKDFYQKEIREKGFSKIEFLPIEEKNQKKKNVDEKVETQIEADLKDLRLNISKKYNLFPVYMVFNNEEMNRLIKANPKTLEELSKVKGFGPNKIETFGKEIIEFFSHFKNSKESNKTEEIYNKLLEERPKIAKYNKLTEDEVYSDKVAEYLAKMKPKTKEDLDKIFGFRKENIEIFGEYLVKVIDKVK